MILIAEGCEVECDSVDEAAKRGHVSCAKVLREYCIPVCEEQMRRVLEGGAYDALTYIRTLWAAHYNIPQSALVLLAHLGKVESRSDACCSVRTSWAVPGTSEPSPHPSLVAILAASSTHCETAALPVRLRANTLRVRGALIYSTACTSTAVIGMSAPVLLRPSTQTVSTA